MPPKQKKRKIKRQKKGNIHTTAKSRKTKDGKVSQVVNVYVTKGGGGRRRQAPKPQPTFLQSQPQMQNAGNNPLLKQIQPLQDKFLAGIRTLNQNNQLLSDLLNKQRYKDASIQTDILTNDMLGNAVKKETASIVTQTPQVPQAEEINLLKESATIGTQYSPPKPKLSIGSDTSLSEGDVSFLENPDYYKGLISGANLLNQYIASDAGSDITSSDTAQTPVSGYNVYDEGIMTPNNEPTPTQQAAPVNNELEVRYEELKGQLRELGESLPVGRRPTRADTLQRKIADMEARLAVIQRAEELGATAI